ncbi:hypothetical protein CDD82_2259 [Ophiocordyceps australis]|uniref:Major facilitator superfamily (MFS) profile domain-containing protein n=1 Tax=Ophiocordyceps australis TaxID=1399860 RepID=A0A2C5XVX9_9HYPO|nr:hypothetical protein CDD82_2259 [Ophiocordyceps australis]
MAVLSSTEGDNAPRTATLSDKNAAALGAQEVNESDSESIMQDGVRQVEAVTKVWPKSIMFTVFVLLYLVEFTLFLFGYVTSNLEAYITSSFKQHGLLALTRIVATIVAGGVKLAIAKYINIRGRCEGFIVMTTFLVCGIIIKALSKSISTYAAGNTIYSIGSSGVFYIIQVVLADMTTLPNRMIVFGIWMSPRIAATFGGPQIAELYNKTSSFGWAFGTFAIVISALALPVAAIFIYYERKARKLAVLVTDKEKKPLAQSIKHYLVEFDVVGTVLLILGLCLFVLPTNLAKMAPQGWSTPYIIVMMVLGIICFASFVVWERFGATVPFFPFAKMKDRTILGACLLDLFLFMSVFSWDTYYFSYLVVVHDLSIAMAGYTLNAYSITSTIMAPFVGLGLRYYGRYYWVAVAGLPFCILGTTLLIHFRQPGMHVAYIVMCQVFHGIGGGFWCMAAPLALMSSVSHQDVAAVIALKSMFGSIGSALGFAIAGALWTNNLPDEIKKALPDEAKSQAAALYASITAQTEHPLGHAIRDAVVKAYGIVQRRMVIAGCVFLPFIVACVVMWHNRPVPKKAQTKGNVF